MSEPNITLLMELIEKLSACPPEKRDKFLKEISLAIVGYSKLAEKTKYLKNQINLYWFLKNPPPPKQ